MSKIFGKIGRSTKAFVTLKLDSVEVMGQSVVDKDMFCIHWTMKGIRGTQSTGETENVRASVPEGSSYPVAAFKDVIAGEVHPRQRKDGNGYEAVEFEMRVVCPALHKKDEKIIGKAIVNVFEKVPVLSAGQPHHAEQTVSLSKDGSAVAHVKLTLALKIDGPAEEVDVAEEPVTPTSPATSEPPAPAAGLVVTPSSPRKEAGSESASTGTAEVKEQSETKSRHRKRRSSNSSAMIAAQLKRKEEEVTQKDEELKKKDEELKQKDEELKKKDEESAEKQKELGAKLEEANVELTELRKANAFLESRVKELEQAKEKTDVVPIDPEHEKMQDNLAKLQEEKETLQEQKMQLNDELEAARKEIAELKAHPVESDQKKELDLLNQQLTVLQEELAKTKKEISTEGETAAPAKNGFMMQAIIGAAGAVVGIIIGLII